MGGKEERKEERRKAAGGQGGGEGNNASGSPGRPGAPGSLSRGRATVPPRPSPRSRRSGQGPLDQGRKGKEGSFGTLRAWLLREEEANKGLLKVRGDLEEGQGRNEGNVGGKDKTGRLP